MDCSPLEQVLRRLRYLAGTFGLILAFSFAVWLLPAAAAAAEAPKRPPNILVIFTDDQSWRTLGCYRNDGAWPWVTTPRIDRLAREGVRFTRAYGAAWCAPARASFLTGRLPHGIEGLTLTDVHEGSYDPAICRFWPAEFRKAGYHTALIGKWHLGRDAGHGRTWDHSVVWDQGRCRGDQYNDQLLSIDGGARREVPGYSTDLYTQYAVDYLQRKHERPWLLWLCYNAPHMKWAVAPRHKDRYPGAAVPIPADVFGPRKDKPRYMEKFTRWRPGRGDDSKTPIHATLDQPLPELVRNYNRVVCALDEGVGRIYEALEKTGQLDNTLIVFTSDQGFAWGDHGFATKIGPYDACMRMPMIVRLPGTAAQGAVCRHPVSLVDLPVTCFALAGLKLPWTMHGHDLRPILKNPAAAWAHPTMLEHFGWEFGPQTDRGTTTEATSSGVPWWIFLCQGKYKYIRTLVPDEIEELYDLDADPQELKNLAVSGAQRERLADHRQRLLAELTRTNAGLTKNLPKVRITP